MQQAGLNALPLSLIEAIDNLYTAFSPYPWRETMPAYPDYLQTHAGFSEPLRQIPAEQLHYYLFKAMSTIGEAVDFKHYLPRMLDAWAHEYLGGESILYHEILGAKIGRADFDTWPENEQNAVRRFYLELWALVLAQYPIYPDAEVVLCSAGQFTSLQPFLDAWHEQTATPALAHLVELFANPPTNAYWDSTSRGKDEQQRLVRWLQKAPTNDLIARARQEAERGNFEFTSQRGWMPLKSYLL